MATQTVELRDLRPAAAGMLAAAAVWPLLPVHPPLACPLRTTTGIPCPFCGMTRAVTAAVRGDLAASLRYNPAGIVLVVLAVALVAGWVMGRLPPRITLPRWLLPVAFGLLWAWNLTLNPTF